MSDIKKNLLLPKDKFYIQHVNIINSVMPVKLTPKEAEVLALFMSFTGSIAEDRFGTTPRKIVRTKLKLSHGGLGNYLSYLKKKKFIVEEQGNMVIKPFLFPKNNSEQSYSFKLTLDADQV